MDTGKRSKNFTEREKSLLIEVAKEFVGVIGNKKIDGTSVEAKKQAWAALTIKFNSVSETGCRTEKQLHSLYDNLKKKAKKNMSDDMSEMYKTGGGTFCPKTNSIDEKVMALLCPQFKPLQNEFDSSAPYYNFDTETEIQSLDPHVESEDILVTIVQKQENIALEVDKPVTKLKRKLLSPSTVAETRKIKKHYLIKLKKKKRSKFESLYNKKRQANK